MSSLSGPLRRRDLRLLVAGSTVSLAGDGIYTVAMAVAVLHIGGTAASLAALAVANVVPRVAFGLLGGVLADRLSRRRVVAVCDLVRLGVVGSLGLLLLGGSPPLWVLLVLVAPLGAASGAAAPAFSSLSGTITMLPFLVSRGYHAPVASFGYLIAVGGVAATVAALVAGSRPAPRRPLVASYVTYALGLGAMAGLGLAPNVLVAGLFVAVFFVGATVGNVFQDSVLGSRVPRGLRGRVSSLDWVAATAASPFSVVVAALSADHVGIRPTYVVAGLAAALASLVGLALLLRSGEPLGDPSEQAAVGVVEAA